MIIGVDLGGTNIRAGIEHNGNILQQKKELFHNKGTLDETLDQFVNFIRPLITSEIEGIGVGVPSVVDTERGVVFNTTNIPSWEQVPLKKILEDEFHIPVSINNDVNCFVLGEHQFGVLKGMRHVAGISCGTGLGCGLIINNQLYQGANCGAGEVGLLHYLNHNIEYYASGNLFQSQFDSNAHDAHQMAQEGNSVALQWWIEYGRHLAQAVKSVMYAYDPEAIVLGGSLSKAYEYFNKSMQQALQDFAFPQSVKRLKIIHSKNENIALLGAAALLGSAAN